MRAIMALVLAMLAAAILFVGWPRIDLAVSGAVFLGDRRFWLTDAPFAVAINEALPTIVLVTVAGILGAAVLGGARRIPALGFRRMLFLVLSFAVGPGLIVNALLKEYWGRARPNDVVQFGGSAQFTPALVPADQCAGNCSFVSGDVSIAFAYVAIALLLPARWRPAGIAAALSFGAFIAMLRLMQGAHFLSDVVFAALFTLLPIAIFARLLLSPDRRNLP
jgi:lipid A 4'-phosphatase